MGDVCMTVPVVTAFALQHPEARFTVLSRSNFKPLYRQTPDNVIFRGVNLADYKGFWGLRRLARELAGEHYDYVVDLHDVLRTKILRTLLKFKGISVSVINKGRLDKWRLTRSCNKQKKQLPTSFQRYAAAIAKALPNTDINTLQHNAQTPQHTDIHTITRIGIAPFAKHEGKIYPLQNMMEVIKTLSERPDTQIMLFGGGKTEVEALRQWEKIFPNTTSCAGKHTLEQEMDMIKQLDVMISMDSANMHIASLLGVPVVSIWGATHRYAGFLGWQQKEEYCAEIDMPCRPCSVFGNKKCKYNDYRCMKLIKPEKVVEIVEKCLRDNAK